MAVAARRAPGSATYAPLSLKGRSDKAVPYPKWRALVRGHARARDRRAPAICAGAQLFLKARALDVTHYVPLPPGIRLPAPPRPGWTAPPRTKRPGTRLAARSHRRRGSRQAHAALTLASTDKRRSQRTAQTSAISRTSSSVRPPIRRTKAPFSCGANRDGAYRTHCPYTMRRSA